MVIGTDGLTNGFIRSTGADDLLTGTAPGFYLQQDGQFRFGQNVLPGNSYIYYSAGTLEIRGKLLTDANEVSEIGNWKVQEGNFQDSTDSIVLNATNKAIQIYDTAGVKKVEIRQANISNPEGSFGSVNIDPPSTYDFSTNGYGSYVLTGNLNFETSSFSTSPFNVAAAGTYTTVLDWGSAEYIQADSSFSPMFSGYFEMFVGAQIWDTPDFSGNLIDSFTLGNSTGMLTGPGETLNVYFSDGYSKSITFATAGDYYIHVTVYGYGYASSGNIVINSYLDAASESFIAQLDQTEIGSDGVLVVASAANYVKIQRTTSAPMIEIKTDQNFPALKITNSNAGAAARAIQVNDGDIYAEGANNNIRVNGGWIGTDSVAQGIRMGSTGGNATVMGQFPGQGVTVAVARLRPGATKFGIAGRELVYDSSTIRIKGDIEDYPDSAYESIKNIKPILYTPLNSINNDFETDGPEDYADNYPMENPKEYIGKQGGFIAEWLDADTELRKYVTYGKDSGGNVTTDAISYDRLVVPLTKAVQILMDKVEALEAYISGSK